MIRLAICLILNPILSLPLYAHGLHGQELAATDLHIIYHAVPFVVLLVLLLLCVFGIRLRNKRSKK